MNENDRAFIINDFLRYVKTGDEKLVRDYSVADIKDVLGRTREQDQNESWYLAMKSYVKARENSGDT